jgi:hypothetical protein
VLVNGVGVAGIGIRLAGGTYTQTGTNGNYSFANLAAGNYQPAVLVDPNIYKSVDNLAKATDATGYSYSVINLAADQNLSGINFNLSIPTATTTPVATTTTAATIPNTTTRTPTLAPTTPTTTTEGGLDFPGCEPPTPLAQVLSFNYCTSQSPSDPNLFRVDVLVFNATTVNIDLSHTFTFGLTPGSQVRRTSVSTGKIGVSSDDKQLVWDSYQLPPGQKATLTFYITRAANAATLVDSIKVSGLNPLKKSVFTAILPALIAQSGTGQSPIYPIQGDTDSGTAGQGGGDVPGGLPSTGAQASVTSPESNFNEVLVALGGLALSALGALALAHRLKRKSKS